MYNLSMTAKPEYDLYGEMGEEYLRLYGVKVIVLPTEKKNVNGTFRDFTHNDFQGDEKEIYIAPENPEGWGESSYNEFGLFQRSSQPYYVSRNALVEVFGDDFTSAVYNSLFLFPSNALMEVTGLSPATGANNQWAFKEKPNIYIVTLKVYSPNIADTSTENVNSSFEEIFEVDLPHGEHEEKENIDPNDLVDDEVNVNLEEIEEYIDAVMDEEDRKSSFEEEWDKL